MLGLGDAFLLKGGHLWVVITTPQGDEGSFVMVNITTLDEDCADESCILGPRDYPAFITHQSYVRYMSARMGDSRMELYYQTNDVTPKPALRREVLRKIQERGLRSDFLKPAFKQLVRGSLVDVPVDQPVQTDS
jgi:hypothetical protein